MPNELWQSLPQYPREVPVAAAERHTRRLEVVTDGPHGRGDVGDDRVITEQRKSCQASASCSRIRWRSRGAGRERGKWMPVASRKRPSVVVEGGTGAAARLGTEFGVPSPSGRRTKSRGKNPSTSISRTNRSARRIRSSRYQSTVGITPRYPSICSRRAPVSRTGQSRDAHGRSRCRLVLGEARDAADERQTGLVHPVDDLAPILAALRAHRVDP